MPFDPLLFLDLAKELASGSAEEAALRTSVSRAYYAVFLMARERLWQTNRMKLRDLRRKNIHQIVISEIKKILWSAGDDLDKLRRLRNLADYKLDPANPLTPIMGVQFRDWPTVWNETDLRANNVLRIVSRI